MTQMGRRVNLGESQRNGLQAFVNEFLGSRTPEASLLASARNRSSILSRAPASVVDLLYAFRDADDQPPYMLVSGFPMRDDADYGKTPPDWKSAMQSDATASEEAVIMLAAAALGDIYSWPTLQNGRLIHNVLPIKGDEQEQNGHSSDIELAWHTEDAFHPCRADYLILFGIRNHDEVGTTLMSIRDVELSDEDRELLFERKYQILPDNEHLRQVKEESHSGLRAVKRLKEQAEPVSVLFGDVDRPYLRIDPFFMKCIEPGSAHDAALQRLIRELNAVKKHVMIRPGDMLIIDNYLSVHGRAPFKARFDGSDRWLKKAVVSRDLRHATVLGFKVSENRNVY